MRHSKPTPAEKEQRAEVAFTKGDRAARDAARKQHLAETLAKLDRTAFICAAALARKVAMQRGAADLAARRKARIAHRGKLMTEYRAWLAKCPMAEWELDDA